MLFSLDGSFGDFVERNLGKNKSMGEGFFCCPGEGHIRAAKTRRVMHPHEALP
jgi:hypothetical protein